MKNVEYKEKTKFFTGSLFYSHVDLHQLLKFYKLQFLYKKNKEAVRHNGSSNRLLGSYCSSATFS